MSVEEMRETLRQALADWNRHVAKCNGCAGCAPTDETEAEILRRVTADIADGAS
jgi:hypothetical protein